MKNVKQYCNQYQQRNPILISNDNILQYQWQYWNIQSAIIQWWQINPIQCYSAIPDYSIQCLFVCQYSLSFHIIQLFIVKPAIQLMSEMTASQPMSIFNPSKLSFSPNDFNQMTYSFLTSFVFIHSFYPWPWNVNVNISNIGQYLMSWHQCVNDYQCQ